MKLEDIRPGYYIAVQKDDQAGVHGRVHVNRLGVLCFQGEYTKVQWFLDSGWTFTRLVPAEEVKNAFLEGSDKDLAWSNSRAKRIAEGLE